MKHLIPKDWKLKNLVPSVNLLSSPAAIMLMQTSLGIAVRALNAVITGILPKLRVLVGKIILDMTQEEHRPPGAPEPPPPRILAIGAGCCKGEIAVGKQRKGAPEKPPAFSVVVERPYPDLVLANAGLTGDDAAPAAHTVGPMSGQGRAR